MHWHAHPLAQLLAPVPVADFVQQLWGRQPHLITAPDPDKFARLFDWERLNQLLNTGVERLHLLNGPTNTYVTRSADQLHLIAEHLRAGATLVLEQIDQQDGELAAFADALSGELGLDVAINLYLSAPNHPGFALHYDTHDVLVLQLAGQKDWQILPPTLSHPLAQHKSSTQTPPPAEAPRQHVQLHPGDVFYLPKGWWHQALARGETPSLHLTLGLFARTGSDLLKWLVSSSEAHPLFRQNLPLGSPNEVLPSPWAHHWQNLYAQLTNLLDQPDLLQRYRQSQIAGLARRQAFALPHQYALSAADLSSVEAFRVVQVPHHLSQGRDGLLELVYPQENLKFAPLAENLLRSLLSQPRITRAQLGTAFPQFPWPLLLEVLLPLVQDGLLIPESPAASENAEPLS
ncbi:MAG: cupin domain-containing protein [Candidatus Sericytochromatia bacterium]